MSLNVTHKDVEKLEKKLGYKGCKNCKNQIGPLRSCEWAEKGGGGQIHFICPKWERRENRKAWQMKSKY